MTLNALVPTDQATLDSLAAYIRENRVAINAQEAGEGFGYTALSLNGETSLTVGSDLEDVGLEIVKVTGTGATTLATILGREASERNTKLTWDEVIRENKRLEVDLTGLKA